MTGTHVLSRTDKGISQDSEKRLASEGNSRPVKRGWRDESAQRKKKARELTLCGAPQEGQVRVVKKMSERGELTNCRVQERKVMTAKEIQRVRGTHKL